MRIDWTTLFLQTINVLVLLWLLRRFLFRPVMTIVAERRDAAEKLLCDAAREREEATTAAAAAARRSAEIAASQERLLAEAHDQAEAQRAELLEAASGEIARRLDALGAEVERERANVRKELEGEAQTLAVSIARRLLAVVPAHAADAGLLEDTEAWIETIDAAALRDLASPAGEVEVVTASPLPAEQRSALAQALRGRMGDAPRLRFTTDPNLLAGVELRGPHVALRNSWNAMLTRIAQELRAR